MRRALPLAALLAAWPLAARASSFFPDSPFSDAALGTTSAPFLKMVPGARAQALGGSFAAASGDRECLYWNPAGLAYVGSSSAGLSYNALLETASAGSLDYVLKRPAGRVLAFGLVYMGQQPLDGYNAAGDPTGTFQAYDYSPSVSVGKQFNGWSAGAGLKLVRSSLAGEGATTAAVDLGLLGRDMTLIGDGPVDLGAYVQNLGPPLKRGDQSDPLPFQAVGGFLWRMYPELHILADAHLPVDQSPYVTFGGEAAHAWAEGAFALRAGYSFKNKQNLGGSAGMTGGFGLVFRDLRLDYAWVPFGELGTTHRFSLSWRFEDAPAKVPAVNPRRS